MSDDVQVRRSAGPYPRRIVSLAPSVTEVLFALDLGERVVGVTRYCDFPPTAQELPKVGGYLDVNYEALVALEPDLVVIIQDHTAVGDRLQRLGLQSLTVDQHDLDGILDSIDTIASACGVSDRGSVLAARLQARVDTVGAATADLEKPRTLIVIGREAGGGLPSSLWAAGPDTFYDDLLTRAGGVNALAGIGVAYPELTIEGLLRLDPEVILDLVTDLDARGLDRDRVRADWRELDILSAVRDERLHVLDQGYMVIPGPRVVDIVESFAAALHPEATP